jgi:protein phosphatase
LLDGVEAVHAVTGIERTRLYNGLRHEAGPFDIIGDVHGCLAELETLLSRLGYQLVRDTSGRPVDAVCPGHRPFLSETLTSALLERLRAAVVSAGLFDELDASWLLFDSELLPWNVKAGDLMRDQYAAVGAAARASSPVAASELSQAAERGIDVGALLTRTRARAANAERFTAAYRRYCWPTSGLDVMRLAPFQLLASGQDRAAGGATYQDRPHAWHIQLADRLVAADDQLVAPTRRLLVDLSDRSAVADGVRW